MLCVLQEFCPLASTKLVESGAQLILPHVPLALRASQQHEGKQRERFPRADLPLMIACDNSFVPFLQSNSGSIAETPLEPGEDNFARTPNLCWKTSSRLIASNASQQRSGNEDVSVGRLCWDLVHIF